jgi:hypothetical protein
MKNLHIMQPGLRTGAGNSSGAKMKLIPSLAVLAALAAPSWGAASPAASQEGVALAIVYDTSGSMKDPVLDANNQPAPKYLIANRALIAIAKQIQAFATNTPVGSPRQIHTGLFVFQSPNARQAIKFGPFDAEAIQNWARNFSTPTGATPLGNALDAAAQTVLKSPLSRKHVLIITDGLNTVGPGPASVMRQLTQQAAQGQTGLSVHFVAFDVDAKQFEAVKKLGATVVGAANEKQLNSQLDYILQKKILLEEEEPPKK